MTDGMTENDLYQQMQKKKNNSLILSNLRQILIQMDKNKYINISNFRNNLFNLFQNHRKFILEQPDDPSDLLFALINSIHLPNSRFSFSSSDLPFVET